MATDDDIRYRNRFREGGDDQPMKRHQKKVFNRATGRFEKPATRMDTTQWWKDKAKSMGANIRRAGQLKKQMKREGVE